MWRLLPVAVMALCLCSALATDLGAVSQCHPVCHWQCTAPVCKQKCEAVCEEPRCDVYCHDPAHYAACTGMLQCTMHLVNATENLDPSLPFDEENHVQCERASCPWAEIKCLDRISCPYADDCEPQCEAPQCAWRCTAPSLDTCAKPDCALVCTKPSCSFT